MTETNPYRYMTADKGTRKRVEFTHGKVSGSVVIAYVGQDGGVFIGTDGAHVNDDNPAITYNGDEFIGRVWVTQDENGAWVASDTAWNKASQWSDPAGKYTRRDNWTDAGKLATRMIDQALMQVMTEHHDPRLQAESELNYKETRAHDAWEAARKAENEARKTKAALREAVREFSKATTEFYNGEGN